MRVLVVDDDIQLASLIAFTLRREGFQVFQAHDGLTALDAWASEAPDIVILDINLPGLSGDMVLQRIRAASATPVIMLTVRGDEDAVVHGLSLGADDYIAKPFRLRELLARVAAALRRPSLGNAAPQPIASILSAGDLTLDPATHTACRGERTLTLKPRAFALLRFFMEHPNQVFSRDQLLRQLWDDPFIGDARTVDVHVRWIREQIEDDPSHPQRLRTIRHVGYQFVG